MNFGSTSSKKHSEIDDAATNFVFQSTRDLNSYSTKYVVAGQAEGNITQNIFLEINLSVGE